MKYLLLILSLFVCGCVGPLVPVVRVDGATAIRLENEIPTLTSSDLEGKKVKYSAQISATSCMNKLYDPAPTERDAINQLRFKASAMGANALTNVMCEAPHGTSLATNCWSSINCYATAVKYENNEVSSNITTNTESKSSSGSGFFVTVDGVLLTNDHVINGCKSIVAHYNGTKYNAEILRRDEKNDIALLKIEGAKTSPLRFRSGDRVRSGENVIALGYPLSGLLAQEPHVSSGIITALAGIRDDIRYLQVSTPVQPGNSGGPLIDERGNVVGIIVGKLDALLVAAATGDIPQNVNFAIKSNVAQSLMDANGINYLENDKKTTFSIADNASQAKSSMAHLTCN